MYMYYIYVRSHRMADHSNRFSWQHGQVSEKIYIRCSGPNPLGRSPQRAVPSAAPRFRTCALPPLRRGAPPLLRNFHIVFAWPH